MACSGAAATVSGAQCRADPPSHRHPLRTRRCDPVTSSDYRQKIDAWRAARNRRLSSESGWLALVDRFPLVEGTNELPIGIVTLDGGVVRLQVPQGVAVTKLGRPVERMELRSDAQSNPDVLEYEARLYELVQHGGSYAVRVRDPNAPALRDFTGIDFFPIDDTWHTLARFEPYDPQRTIELVYDEVTVARPCPGAVAFEVDGRSFRLDPIVEDGKRLLLMFGDETNRQSTYGGGRFLYAELPRGSEVELDFNLAFNPPCAFTPYVACPLVPSQNQLPLRIEAGERRFGGS